jgi:O-antigen ligase
MTTPLALAVFFFAGWVAFHTLVLSPAYSPAGLYHPLLLALGFAAARRFDELTERRAALAALAGGAILVLWGLAQAGPMGLGRARAFFEAPATYAAILNLLLLPLLALVLVGRRHPAHLACAALLAAGVFASTSRGGYVALATGAGVAIVLARRGGLLQGRGVLAACGIITAGCIMATAVRWVPVEEGEREAPPTAESRAGSSLMRLELYELSLRAWREQPLAGTGYATFYYVFDRGRERAPSFELESETWFAHNDYLQSLQEVGPLGLAGLLALAGLPLLLAYRRTASLPEEERAGTVAVASGLATMASHALVDFPFYIPACLLLYGALLGMLDRRLSAAAQTPENAQSSSLPAWQRAVRAIAVSIAAIAFLKPVLAEAAGEWGLHRYAADRAQSAAFWLETARRLEPADWRYHWYAGQFWDGTAAASRSRDAARFAHAAFATGVAANPLDVHNLLGMIALHRRLGHLLEQPADRAARAAWVARAEALAPWNPVVRRERALLESAR